MGAAGCARGCTASHTRGSLRLIHVMRQLSFLVPEDEPAVSVDALPDILSEQETVLRASVPLTSVPISSVPLTSEAIEAYDVATYEVEQIQEQGHPFPAGTLFSSPGGHFTYRVIGPCCRLFDREELPWPCCRLQWRGKEPSWRRIGRRFVLDTASRHSPSYNVEIVELGHHRETIVMTLYAVRLSNMLKNWWYAKPRL